MQLQMQQEQYMMQDPNMMHQMQMQQEGEEMDQQFYVSLATAVTHTQIFKSILRS